MDDLERRTARCRSVRSIRAQKGRGSISIYFHTIVYILTLFLSNASDKVLEVLWEREIHIVGLGLDMFLNEEVKDDGVLPIVLHRCEPNNTMIGPSVNNAGRYCQRPMEDP